MRQMNISITQQLSAYVRKKVRSGHYNNASEVVRDALRRMEEEDARAVRLAQPTAEDLLTDLTGMQLDAIRRRVQAGVVMPGLFRNSQRVDKAANIRQP